VVIQYRRFVTTYRSHIQRSRSLSSGVRSQRIRLLESWIWGQKFFPETSVRNYRSTLCNIHRTNILLSAVRKAHGKLECRYSSSQRTHRFLLMCSPLVYVNQPRGYRCQFAGEQNRVVEIIEGKGSKYPVGKNTTPWAKLEGVTLWDFLAWSEYFQTKSRECQFVWNIRVSTLKFRDKWVPVTTAWRVLSLRMKERPPVWRVAVNVLNKQSPTADKWSSSLGVGRCANNSSP
jgi:hypothetical protein